jgi:hypothetical protein
VVGCGQAITLQGAAGTIASNNLPPRRLRKNAVCPSRCLIRCGGRVADA